MGSCVRTCEAPATAPRTSGRDAVPNRQLRPDEADCYLDPSSVLQVSHAWRSAQVLAQCLPSNVSGRCRGGRLRPAWCLRAALLRTHTAAATLRPRSAAPPGGRRGPLAVEPIRASGHNIPEFGNSRACAPPLNG